MMRPWLGPRVYALFALGVAIFTLYGSYVPFHFRNRPRNEVTSAFQWAMEQRIGPESRSDWVSNCLLGVPLGFCLLGWIRVDRSSQAVAIAVGIGLLPLCLAFAAAVEFGQLYFPGRTCAGSDVVAQGTGAALGVFGWILWGQHLTDKFRGLLDQPGQAGNSILLLVGYAFFVLLVQLLPLDLTASPNVLFHKVKDPLEVTRFPLGEFDRPLDEWRKVQSWFELIALCWPLGALVARLPGKWASLNGLPRLVGTGLLFAAATEASQLMVSRHPSATDVLVIAFAMLLGWSSALALADRGVQRSRVAVALAFGTAWMLVLVFVQWHPFNFDPGILGDRLSELDWMPLAGQASKNYLWALDEVLTKFTLFVPPGVLWIWTKRSSLLTPILISGGIAALLEFGQVFLPGRVASPTDILFGVIGGGIGAAATRRLMNERPCGWTFSIPQQPVAIRWANPTRS